MTRRAVRWLVCLALSGCANSEEPTDVSTDNVQAGDWIDVNGDGFVDGIALDSDGDGIVDSVDLDGDGTPDGLLPGHERPGEAPGEDAAVSDRDAGDGPDDPSGKPDSGADAPLEPPVIEIPTAVVPCGNSPCEIRDGQVCCDFWTNTGFGNAPMCLTEDACVLSDPTGITDSEGLYGMSLIDSKRAVVSRCDGAEDCSVGQVCCYVRYGAPIPDSLFSTTWVGPGASRQCMNVDACSDIAAVNGVPTGLVSCNDNDDCKKVPGTTCQPEQDNTASTGKNVKARKGFMVCR